MRPSLGGRLVLALVVTAVAATACGSSLSREEILAARRLGGGGGGVGGASVAGETFGGEALEGGSAGGAAAGTSQGTGAAAGSVSAGAGGGIAQPPPAVRLTASDVGITPDRIIIGNVSALSGPLPPYPGPVAAIESLFREINAKGGILGRRLELRVIDDGLDPRRNLAAHRQLADQVFMFLGSLTLADRGGASVIKEKRVPDIGFALNKERAYLPTHARLGAQAGLTEGGKSDTMARHAKKLGVTKMGVLWLAADAARIDANAFLKTLEAQGIESPADCRREVQLVEPDYTSHILELQRNGCDGFYFVADLNSAGHFQRDMKRQRYSPKFALYPLTIYEEKFAELAGGPDVAEGASLYFDQVPFEDRHPKLLELAGIMRKHFPQYDPRAYGVVPNWQDTLLFLDALAASGPNPTRKRFLEELDEIRGFNAEGLAPVWSRSPLAKLSQPCWIVMTYRNGSWRRANATSGFFCGTVVK